MLDRLSGELLLAEPFVDSLTWASEIGSDGRPVLLRGAEPTYEGVKVCPAIEGANNWMSTAFSSATGLFYVMALERCNIYTKSDEWWREGESFYGGSYRLVPGEPGKKYLRAINVDTGEIVWEIPQVGRAETWGGVLSTAGGLVFYGDDSGAFAAADAAEGRPLWRFPANQNWKASPMTYMVEGRQFVAVAGNSDILGVRAAVTPSGTRPPANKRLVIIYLTKGYAPGEGDLSTGWSHARTRTPEGQGLGVRRSSMPRRPCSTVSPPRIAARRCSLVPTVHSFTAAVHP